jgi:hypothetical protein
MGDSLFITESHVGDRANGLLGGIEKCDVKPARVPISCTCGVGVGVAEDFSDVDAAPAVLNRDILGDIIFGRGPRGGGLNRKWSQGTSAGMMPSPDRTKAGSNPKKRRRCSHILTMVK